MERTYGALWLREGLAVHLSNRLSRWPVFMRLEGNLIELNPKSTEDLARARLTTAAGQQAWSLVGGNGVPTLGSGDVRTLFYVLSGSFVAFVDQQSGDARTHVALPILRRARRVHEADRPLRR